MSYDQVVGALGGDDASSGVVVIVSTVWGSSWGSIEAMASVVASWGGRIWTFAVVVSLAGIVPQLELKALMMQEGQAEVEVEDLGAVGSGKV